MKYLSFDVQYRRIQFTFLFFMSLLKPNVWATYFYSFVSNPKSELSRGSISRFLNSFHVMKVSFHCNFSSYWNNGACSLSTFLTLCPYKITLIKYVMQLFLKSILYSSYFGVCFESHDFSWVKNNEKIFYDCFVFLHDQEGSVTSRFSSKGNFCFLSYHSLVMHYAVLDNGYLEGKIEVSV